jgi:hypothetical protein
MLDPTEREYTNGRIRVRPEQIEYIEQVLHTMWVEVSRTRARVKEALDKQGVVDSSALVTEMNRELRLIKSIQDEVRRTKEDMGLV